ncbi:membrane protein [Geomonas sp. Red276]
MRKVVGLMAVVSLLVFGGMVLTAQGADKLTSSEKAFIKDAASGGDMEAELGKMAQANGSAQEVKDFGKRMETDHTKAGAELKALAAQNNLQLPAQMERKDKAMVDKLSKYTGAEFDKKYMHAMVKDHKKDVAKFKAASKKAKDPALKQWIDKTLPTLEEHLELAKSTAAKVGAK